MNTKGNFCHGTFVDIHGSFVANCCNGWIDNVGWADPRITGCITCGSKDGSTETGPQHLMNIIFKSTQKTWDVTKYNIIWAAEATSLPALSA